MAYKLPLEAFEGLLKEFLRNNGWPPKCGYYLSYLGADFNTYIKENGFPNAKNSLAKGFHEEVV